jgi:amino acid transporter
VLFSVCTSAVAGSLTSMITTSRTTYSMARARALPGVLGKVHPRWQTPWVANAVVALIGTTYFVLLTAVSEDFLTDSVEGVGLLVVFFYAMTAIASAVYFRRRLGGGIGVAWRYVLAPALGGLMLAGVFVKAAIDAGKPDAGTLGTVFGIGTPLVIAVGSLVVGLILCLTVRARDRTFFAQPRETAPAEIPAPRP